MIQSGFINIVSEVIKQAYVVKRAASTASKDSSSSRGVDYENVVDCDIEEMVSFKNLDYKFSILDVKSKIGTLQSNYLYL